jgi:sulfate transporter 4
VAFIVTTFAGVEYGLMSSIALSLLILVLESSFPHTAQLGRIGKSNVYRWVWVSGRYGVGGCKQW